MKQALIALGAVAIFAAGVLSSQTIAESAVGQRFMALALIPLRLHQDDYPLINPLLLCDVGNSADSVQNKELRKKIMSFIDDRQAAGDVAQMSVYLQRYGGGGWVGVNETKLYAPASLLKVPLMIAYYKIAQGNSGFLDQKITFKGTNQNSIEYFKSGNVIEKGETYSIEELIAHMIDGSDNTATALLQNALDTATREDTYSDLGLPTPPKDPNAEYISVKHYAYFFRLLYNATYLNREYSERALMHLSSTDFAEGIRAGVPAGVTVAQKFGERTVLNSDGSVNRRELHDCGIVYKKGSNYLLCVMTKGNNFDAMAQSIANLSSLVYSEVSLPPSPTN